VKYYTTKSGELRCCAQKVKKVTKDQPQKRGRKPTSLTDDEKMEIRSRYSIGWTKTQLRNVYRISFNRLAEVLASSEQASG
jgi:hypothetical protein